MRLALIAAVARNGVIGKDNKLLWHLPEDLKFFRHTTMGCPILMGRKTFESIGRPLPGRRNVVISRNAEWIAPGVEVATSLPAALTLLHDATEVFVIGGSQVYAEALPFADELFLTEIDKDFEGNVRFPDWDRSAFVEVSRQQHRAGPPNDFDYAFVTYRRKTEPPRPS